MRLLFSSIHCYLDPSSGAALCARELLELLAGRGMDCRVLTTGVLDPERETSLYEVLATLELPTQRFQAEPGTGRAAEVIESRRAVARPAGVGDLPRAGRAWWRGLVVETGPFFDFGNRKPDLTLRSPRIRHRIGTVRYRATSALGLRDGAG